MRVRWTAFLTGVLMVSALATPFALLALIDGPGSAVARLQAGLRHAPANAVVLMAPPATDPSAAAKPAAARSPLRLVAQAPTGSATVHASLAGKAAPVARPRPTEVVGPPRRGPIDPRGGVVTPTFTPAPPTPAAPAAPATPARTPAPAPAPTPAPAPATGPSRTPAAVTPETTPAAPSTPTVPSIVNQTQTPPVAAAAVQQATTAAAAAVQQATTAAAAAVQQATTAAAAAVQQATTAAAAAVLQATTAAAAAVQQAQDAAAAAVQEATTAAAGGA